MSIVEYHTNTSNKCHECKYFKTNEEDWFYGECICKDNKIKNRNRCATDKSCLFKTKNISKEME